MATLFSPAHKPVAAISNEEVPDRIEREAIWTIEGGDGRGTTVTPIPLINRVVAGNS